MTKAELRQLQEAFRLEVVFAGDPDRRPLPCFFAAFDSRPCSGPIQACHWFNRQRIKGDLWKYGVDPDLIVLAEWDPRLAVPGCGDEHHPRWDSHRVTLPSERLWVFRHEVPVAVDRGAGDWGLESALEERSPLFDSGVAEYATRKLSQTREARRIREDVASERALFDV